MRFSELSTRFGEDTARMICEELGGDTVYFPKPRSRMKPKIIELWRDGLATHAIAERLECSERHVRRVVGC